jgi:segregation and condensation protein A
MDTSETYQVRLEAFQGPLDLLLFLIKKRKIDIHDIPIAVITREYLEYLNHKERLNLDREAEFLLVAALLIYIKSQMLLPREKALEEEKDLRQLLVERLVDYQKIKTASLLLKEKEDKELQIWRRSFLPPLAETDEMDFIEVSLFDLAESFFRLMKQKEREEARTIKGEQISLEQKMREIIKELKKSSYLDFLDYFNRQESFEEAFVAFFSLLELVKSRIVIATQESHFQPIKVWLRKKAYKSN